jgi:CTP:molybdopterin cytidylyltransferase MocA
LDGNFIIENIPSNSKLEISYVGMQKQVINLDGRTTLDIVMKEDIAALNEVVVVGYGSQERRDLTSAVTTVKSKDFL